MFLNEKINLENEKKFGEKYFYKINCDPKNFYHNWNGKYWTGSTLVTLTAGKREYYLRKDQL
jgi:hypothetical protein